MMEVAVATFKASTMAAPTTDVAVGGWELWRLRDVGAVEAMQPKCCKRRDTVMADRGRRGGDGRRDAWKVMVLGLGRCISFFYSV